MLSRLLCRFALAAGSCAAAAPTALPAAPEAIRSVSDFALSPDGQTLAFAWAGDLWSVPSTGGAARPLTRDPADDREPRFSPDGTEIAFTSNRTGTYQVYVMPAAGGAPEALTAHSEGYGLLEYAPDGASLLVTAVRDQHWRNPGRFYTVARTERVADRLLFDDYGRHGRLSPDGGRCLFTREGTSWFRKGYRGSQAQQIWEADLAAGTFTARVRAEYESRHPLWQPDGRGFWYVAERAGKFGMWSVDLASGAETRLFEFDDDWIVNPAVSRDGRTLVFLHLFDLYRFRPGIDSAPARIDVWNGGEPVREEILRRSLSSASEVAFSSDGLDVAFIAGGDLWVMDTELREPRRVTATPEAEHDPVFNAAGDAILFVSDRDGQSDIWRAERADPRQWWWQNSEFVLVRLTEDAAIEGDLTLAPDGKLLAFVRGSGDLMAMDEHGGDARRLVASWNSPSYDWSPDGKWITYAVQDDDFNSDVWVAPVDGSRAPFNVSVHPDNDGSPRWSPDGKVLAYTGRHANEEIDLYYVYLREDDADQSSRDRTLEKAAKKMEKERKKKDAQKGPDKDKSDGEPSGAKEPGKDKEKDADKPKEGERDALPEVKIDFDGLQDRIRTISIPDSSESGLFFVEDQKLVFNATIDGKRGLQVVTFPDELKPKSFSATPFSGRLRLKAAKAVGGLSGDAPAVVNASGQVTSYAFRVRQELGTTGRFRAGFDLAWRLMRDNYYDERLGNRNWDAIRRKYAAAAESAVDPDAFERVIALMLGELNGSHLGFNAAWEGYRSALGFTDVTAHLGLRFDPTFSGPGWKVRDVIVDGPADEPATRIRAGEVVLAIDGRAVDPSQDAASVLNGDLDRDVALLVKSETNEERTVRLRPTSFGAARERLYDMWLERNRKAVDAGSAGRFGYLHIRGMSWPSFLEFEQQLYRVGYRKDGLVIDVRGNGGGSTADHLLTALTQPRHAITVPRGGGPGYPQDRQVYASWWKPIVVLCDQDSFSNAEIFAHAIKTLGRGKLIGVATAGGVISTGAASVLDLGTLRQPFRGWFGVLDGKDQELNGAVPDFVVWPEPGDFARGLDRQLDQAIAVLKAEVDQAAARGWPPLKKASER